MTVIDDILKREPFYIKEAGWIWFSKEVADSMRRDGLTEGTFHPDVLVDHGAKVAHLIRFGVRVDQFDRYRDAAREYEMQHKTHAK